MFELPTHSAAADAQSLFLIPLHHAIQQFAPYQKHLVLPFPSDYGVVVPLSFVLACADIVV